MKNSLILALCFTVILQSCESDPPCVLDYDIYLIEFSEQSLAQNPFLELQEYVITQTQNVTDTFGITTNLTSEGNRRQSNRWECLNDTTISETYWYYYSYIEAFFKDRQSNLSFVMATKNCPDLYNPEKYSEFFQLIVSKNYNTNFGDHHPLIRFITNQNGASDCHQRSTESFDQGQFHTSFDFGGKTYTNVWHGKADFLNKEIQAIYSPEFGLKAYAVDSLITVVIGYK